eukprot:GDKJ01015519.1.p1 GENE.GDKJ01015519.1~~GDKJ01015519.1.p1  ORF type:complete len:442 (-),score=67.51 GDKJ01015519.1:50-1375(-)
MSGEVGEYTQNILRRALSAQELRDLNIANRLSPAKDPEKLPIKEYFALRFYVTVHFGIYLWYLQYVARNYFESSVSDVEKWMIWIPVLGLGVLFCIEVSVAAHLGKNSESVQKFSWDIFSAFVGFFNQLILFFDVLFLIRLYKIVPAFLYVAFPAFLMGHAFFSLLIPIRHVVGLYFREDSFGIDMPSTICSCICVPGSGQDAVDVFASAHSSSLAARIAQRRRVMGLDARRGLLERVRLGFARWTAKLFSSMRGSSRSVRETSDGNVAVGLLEDERGVEMHAPGTMYMIEQNEEGDEGEEGEEEDEEEEVREHRNAIENKPVNHVEMVQVFATGQQMQQVTITTQLVNMLSLTSALRREYLAKERHERVEFSTNIAFGTRCMINDVVFLVLKLFTIMSMEFSPFTLCNLCLSCLAMLLGCCQVTTYPMDETWEESFGLNV